MIHYHPKKLGNSRHYHPRIFITIQINWGVVVDITIQEFSLTSKIMFVCFQGRSEYHGLPWFPLCLTNRIRICRVPRSTNESQCCCVLTFPKVDSFLHTSMQGCIRNVDPKTNLQEIRKGTTEPALHRQLRFRLITGQRYSAGGSDRLSPHCLLSVVAVRLDSQIEQLFH